MGYKHFAKFLRVQSGLAPSAFAGDHNKRALLYIIISRKFKTRFLWLHFIESHWS